MPSTKLAAYLAKNYLTASKSRSDLQPASSSGDFQDSTRPKKKRRKDRDAVEGGLIVADDDDELTLRGKAAGTGDNEGEDVPTFDAGVKSAEFRKKKGGSGWKTVSAATEIASARHADANDEDTEADRIIAEAAAEANARRREIEDEDAPAIVDDGPRMSSGARVGLQTAADTAALVEREVRERQLESRRSTKTKKSKEASLEEETIYRDATGRRIDVSMKRAEARAAEQEKVREERKAREDAMGDVQRREKEARKQDLEDAKFLTVARGIDDEDMNEDLKKVQRWDDPMAAYMAEKRAEETVSQAVATKGRGNDGPAVVQKAKKKVYTGHAPPNRYGIAPGWRWDGVDRGNGFEKDWFQARSRNTRNEDLKYQWQMDE